MSVDRVPADSKVFFSGRPGDIRIGQWVKAVDSLPPNSSQKVRAVIFGYPDDQGVVLNRGRAGAAAGPDSIRRHLYRMTLPADFEWEQRLELYDFGNARIRKSLNETHSIAQSLASHVGSSGALGIALGGGHDFAACTFQGFRDSSASKRWGLINIDPHLDARECEDEQMHSGNPFRVLLERKALRGPDLIQFGARPNRNTRSSWEFCQRQGVSLLSLESLRNQKFPVAALFEQNLKKLSQSCDQIGLTIDMDCCSDAEGTSAAPVVGFSAWELLAFAAKAGENKKVTYLELAEVAPALEPHERSSRIASEVIFSFLHARSRLVGKALKKRSLSKNLQKTK